MHQVREKGMIEEKYFDYLDQFFNDFPTCYIKILLGDLNAKVGRGNIFKPKLGNESLHQDRNNNGFGIVKVAPSKI
jgi:hypothetical protein